MADEALRIRFSRWYHHTLYRYSVPASAVKIVAEVLLWGGLGYMAALALVNLAGLPATVTTWELPTRPVTAVPVVLVVIRRMFCKTTVAEDRL